MDLGVRTYKTSIYHPNSNPAERVLREVGRILRTYCHDQQRKWRDYIEATENFINLAYHESIRDTPYTIMYGKPPPRAIEELINFPTNPEYKFDNARFYSKIAEQVEKKKDKYRKIQPKIIQYQEGEKVLIRNRELPSSRAVSYTHLYVYKRQIYPR